MCDLNKTTNVCNMDGAGDISCSGTCPTKPQFKCVDNSTGILISTSPANMDLPTTCSNPTRDRAALPISSSSPELRRPAADDAAGIFASENLQPDKTTTNAGCIALSTTTVKVIKPTDTKETQTVYPCFEHQTLTDLLESSGVTWKYYAPSAGSIWTAPNSIQHISGADAPTGGTCKGSDWLSDVVLKPQQVLTDISSCKLAGVSWVVIGGQSSDHAKATPVKARPGWRRS